MEAAHHVARYDPRSSGSYHLSILATPSHQAWCVHEVRDARCLALYAMDGAELPNTADLPEMPLSVSFLAAPELSTLVPMNALTPGSEVAHLSLVHGQLPTGLLRDEPVDAIGARCIYLHDEGCERKVLERFPAAHPIALRTLLVHKALEKGRNCPALIAHRMDKRLDLAIAGPSGLLLSNSYHVGGATDVLFHMLFALEQLKILPNTVFAYTGGPTWGQDDNYLIRRYFLNAAPSVDPAQADMAALGVPAPERWAALLHQIACVS